MRYLALATDYDGTLATYGQVAESTLQALMTLQSSGRRLVLVTGRQLDELLRVFPHADAFDRIVAENGAVLYRPSGREVKVLATPPPEAFVRALEARGVEPLQLGAVVVATLHPNEQTVLEVIRDLGLELQVIFNKGSVMVLPAGVNKASGLAAALRELGLSAHNVVGVGDAENDHAFLTACQCGVAVAGALPMLKETADWVTDGDTGEGVAEVIARLVDDDLKEIDRTVTRHLVRLGTYSEGPGEGEDLVLPPLATSILVAGPSGSGKSTTAGGVIETLIGAGYQVCLMDPEGDYEDLGPGVVLGTGQQPPAQQEVLQVLENPDSSVVVNLVGLKVDERPGYFATLLPRIQALRARTGRPHWLVIDEAHHLLPHNWDLADVTVPRRMEGLLLITVHPAEVSSAVLQGIDLVLAVGGRPEETLAGFVKGLGGDGAVPPIAGTPRAGEVVAWLRAGGAPPRPLQAVAPQVQQRRHQRKYAQGDVGPERSFFFRGPEQRLNLRAQNLLIFAQLAEGVDDETWMHHLRQGDYSRWFREVIKDPDLAGIAAGVEEQPGTSAPQATRTAILEAIRGRYTLPAGDGVPGQQ